MKACPTPTCAQTVPEKFLPEMVCYLCVRYGPPTVRNKPEVKVERKS